MFLVTVNKNQISVAQSEPITSGSVNAYLVQFDFSEEWSDLTRVAVFKTTGEPIDVLLDDSNMCFVPWEVMTEFGKTISFGVYGTRGDEIVLPTIWAKTAAILEGVVTGIPARDPEPTLLAQLMDKIKSLEEQLEAVSGVKDVDLYPTTETQIGTYKDGRPIYRRFIECNSGATVSIANVIWSELKPSQIQLLRLDGTMDYSASVTTAINWCSYNATGTKLEYLHTAMGANGLYTMATSSYLNKPMHITMDYMYK